MSARADGVPCVLCGVDGSPHSRRAAIAAHRLAGRLRARLTLVHVAPTRTPVPVASVPEDADPAAYAHSTELARAEAADAFARLEPHIGRAGVDRVVRLGEPASVLAELATERGAELIVVGARGRGPWRAAALGSVSAELTRLSPCPVVIVAERAAVAQGSTSPRRMA